MVPFNACHPSRGLNPVDLEITLFVSPRPGFENPREVVTATVAAVFKLAGGLGNTANVVAAAAVAAWIVYRTPRYTNCCPLCIGVPIAVIVHVPFAPILVISMFPT